MIKTQSQPIDSLPWTAEQLAAFRLARASGIGAVQFRKLLGRFGNVGAALRALPGLIATGRWPGVSMADEPMVLAELREIERAEADFLVLGEQGYPALLAELDSAPPVLMLRGDPSVMARPAVAIVGARNASANGCMLARRLAGELAEAGLLVVSGLARGIDTAAHEGAIERPGGTVAVIASGVDIAYPSDNADLMERIVRLGCVVGERPMGAAPQARHFPRRNRIIAGLVTGVVVVEAAPQSGSLITARLAADAGREVMAVPGSPLDPRHKGTNQLLRDGATLIETAQDVLTAIGQSLPQPVRSAPSAVRRRVAPAPNRSSKDVPQGAQAGVASLSPRLMEVLGPEPVSIDELIRQCHASPAAIQETILELELEGRIERHPGGRVARKAG